MYRVFWCPDNHEGEAMNNNYWNQKGITKQIGAEITGYTGEVGSEDHKPVREGGKEITFYPLPVGVILKLKNTFKEAAPFLAMCFTDYSRDVEIDTTSGVKETTDGTFPVTNTVTKAVSPSAASFRFQQKERSIESLIDTLFSESTKDLLSEIICASASDAFSEEDKSTLLDNTPTPIFIELLIGVAEANKGAFGGLGEFLPRLLQSNEVLADGAAKIKEAVSKK